MKYFVTYLFVIGNRALLSTFSVQSAKQLAESKMKQWEEIVVK